MNREPDRDRNWMGRNLRWVLLLLGAIGIVLAARMAMGIEPKGGDLLDQDIATLQRIAERSQQEVGMLKIRLAASEAAIAELRAQEATGIRFDEIIACVNGGSVQQYMEIYKDTELPLPGRVYTTPTRVQTESNEQPE